MSHILASMKKRIGARATIIDIARLAGVSKSTVSLVLKDSPRVRRETREAVLQAMQALGYVYNRSAANLRMARTNFVGMVISDLINPFFAEFAVGLEEAFHQAGYVSMVANTNEDIQRQIRIVNSMLEQGVAGIVISPALGSTATNLLPQQSRSDTAILTALRRLQDSDLPYIGQDNVTGSLVATRSLIELGHRRIAYLGGHSKMATQRERVEGYRMALLEAGLPFETALVIETAPSRLGGAGGIIQALLHKDPPTAALCFNDIVAIGAMGHLRQSGYEVGRDFSIIGFDDIAEAAYTAPALTSVACDTQALGFQAGQLLMKMIAEGSVPDSGVFGHARLVKRASCGPAPAAATLQTGKRSSIR